MVFLKYSPYHHALRDAHASSFASNFILGRKNVADLVHPVHKYPVTLHVTLVCSNIFMR